VLSGVRIYFKYIRMHLLSGLEYKGWWVMTLNVLFAVVTDPISTFLMFSRFGSIGPWTVERIILIYAMAVTSYGLAESFCRGFDYFPWKMIRSGDFDRLLLRPRSLFLQVVGSFFHIHRLSRPLAGLVVIFWCLRLLNVPATPYNALILLCALSGGLIMYCGAYVLTSGIAFFTIKGLDWIYLFTNAGYQVTRCPPDYMPRLMKGAFTFAVPILVISYYPAAALCGWGAPPWTGWLALPAGLAFLCAALAMWRVGVRHYRSAGS